MLKMHPYASFDAAARAALKFLHDRLGFDLWMVTRTEGENWIVLQAEDHGYGVHDGAVFRWADSFCSQMVLGRGPCIAPSAMEVPAYATAPIGNVVDIGAYVGVPLTLEDGSLFGTLCAIDPAPQPEEIAEDLTLIEMISRMLSTILHAELNAEAQSRLAEQARTLALTDGLTGLYNRRGWDQLATAEEGRCRRYGHSASVLSIDLDGLKDINDQQGHAAGDELIRRAAHVIEATKRDQDIAARIGGDEFVVLAIECNQTGARSLRERMVQAFAEAEVNASMGLAYRDPAQGIRFAIQQADLAMYDNKRSRRDSCAV